uniref:Uncharacterized protein n=1 Tax=Lactuca sativa TaxID=4236 RepID=A0A9R1VDA4_LACSA|nr:hypothetical protein LSAT_V11C500276830 [Lactuca sativa]
MVHLTMNSLSTSLNILASPPTPRLIDLIVLILDVVHPTIRCFSYTISSYSLLSDLIQFQDPMLKQNNKVYENCWILNLPFELVIFVSKDIFVFCDHVF